MFIEKYMFLNIYVVQAITQLFVRVRQIVSLFIFHPLSIIQLNKILHMHLVPIIQGELSVAFPKIPTINAQEESINNN